MDASNQYTSLLYITFHQKDCAFAKLQTFLPAYTQDLIRVAGHDGRLDTRKTEGRVERKPIIWILDDIPNIDIHVKIIDYPPIKKTPNKVAITNRVIIRCIFRPFDFIKKPISQVQLCCVRK
jgi:hypothetical protein